MTRDALSQNAPAREQLDASQVRANGWRQGSLLSRALIQKLREGELLREIPQTEEQAVVVSHDCDVTNASWEREPAVELLLGHSVPAPDNSVLWRKNPRRLQISYEAGYIDFCIHYRAVVPRTWLARERPNGSISDQGLREIRGWLTARYLRAAFPDAFNLRIKPAVEKIRVLCKEKDSALINALYFMVGDEELGPESECAAKLVGTMPVSLYDDLALRQKATTFFQKIEAAVNCCVGISLEDSGLRSEAEISIDLMKHMKRWDFDDLTIRRGEDPPVNPA